MIQRFNLISIITCAIAITACGTTSDPTRFYSLQPNYSEAFSSSGSETSLSLAVASIRIPRLIDRSQIVSRKNDHEIIRSEYHQWAGSIKDEIEKLIVTELENSLGKDHIPVLPTNNKLKPDLELNISILRFDGTLGKNVVLNLNWQLTNRVNRTSLHAGTSKFELPLSNSSYSTYVSGLSRLIRNSAAEIADQIAIINQRI